MGAWALGGLVEVGCCDSIELVGLMASCPAQLFCIFVYDCILVDSRLAMKRRKKFNVVLFYTQTRRFFCFRTLMI